MCWLVLWESLLALGFDEAVIASCVFGSIHRKEFRFLCYLLDVAAMERRCPGGHTHVRVEGSYTKASAVYVDGLAWHVGEAFHKALKALEVLDSLGPDVQGQENILANDIMTTSKWHTVRAWFWKRISHINVLELASAVSVLGSVAKSHSSVRFASFLDSSVCRGALAKGRSASYALQPGLRRACAWCIAFDLYPAWPFSPTRLKVADDPSRGSEPRVPVPLSLAKKGGLDLCKGVASGLRRFAANWCRLCLLVLVMQPAHALDFHTFPSGFLPQGLCSLPTYLAWFVAGAFFSVLLCIGLSCLVPLRVGCNTNKFSGLLSFHPPRRPVRVAMVLLLLCSTGGAMPIAPGSETERQRVIRREGANLVATRAIKQQTRDRRKTYLDWFRKWLWNEKKVSFRFLMDHKPPDPEKLSEYLVDYGKELFRAGKAYGVFAETINSVAVERPLIRRQLTSAWDLAFAWLADEPHAHHPAMPISLMAAMVVVALYWGWPFEASVILMSWTGVMRIGEVLAARRKDVVFPSDAAPGTSFMLIIIRTPKTRGRSAHHQAARIDQVDVIRFLEAMYKDAPDESSIWPYSAATLRKRFKLLLEALQLPFSKGVAGRPFDLGSMRPGGATWMLHQTENPEYVRRRGRWLSSRVMEIYLQEVLVTTFLEKLRPRTRFLIELCAGEFAIVIDRVITFLDTGIPPRTWFSLLRCSGDIPTENVRKVGKNGSFWSQPREKHRAWHDETSMQDSEKGSRDILDFKKSNGDFRGSSLPMILI